MSPDPSLDTKELCGLSYSNLSEEWQSRFISYSISIDMFVGADQSEVRQVFRRMNSYTVPLNPEELRHADNQGAFKWFISTLGSAFSGTLSDLGIFNQKALVRMQDLKLFTEICHAMDNGITTTSRKSLDTLYRRYDAAFPRQDEFASALDYAFRTISQMTFLRGSNLAKHYQIYSLALALAHTQLPIPGMEPTPAGLLRPADIERALLDLSAALDLSESDIPHSRFREFIEASADRTNVKEQRERRFRFYLAAVVQSSN